MAREYGDKVTMWSTFNEPWCYAYLGHAAGVHAPGLTDPKAAVTVAHHQLLAHGLALQAMRAQRDGLSLGIVINPSNVRSEGLPPAPEDQMAIIDAIHNRWWFDGTLKGEYPADLMQRYGHLAEAVQPGDLDLIRQPLDWIGINYYFDILVRGIGSNESAPGMPAYPTITGTTEADTRAVHTDMGWPITPDGFTSLLVRLKDDYPNLPPVYITENGCAYDDPVIEGACHDPRRIEYLDLHLRALTRRDRRRRRRARVLPVVADGQLRVGARLRQAVRPGARRLRHPRAHATRQRPLVPRGHPPQRPRRRRALTRDSITGRRVSRRRAGRRRRSGSRCP